jgi:hypothetical protein
MPGSFDNVSDVVLGTDWRKASAITKLGATPRVAGASTGRAAAFAS